jgi:hypothetical protein
LAAAAHGLLVEGGGRLHIVPASVPKSTAEEDVKGMSLFLDLIFRMISDLATQSSGLLSASLFLTGNLSRSEVTDAEFVKICKKNVKRTCERWSEREVGESNMIPNDLVLLT